MFIIECQYWGETTWHYYGTCETLTEAEEWVDELNSDPPGKVRQVRMKTN